MLEEFDNIIKEYQGLPDNYKVIIKDITKEMGYGMAMYCEDDDFNKKAFESAGRQRVTILAGISSEIFAR